MSAAPSFKLLSPLSIAESKTNPRKHHDKEAHAELTESVRKLWVLQAILVRPKGDEYELVAGHRRLRAARAAGIKAVPASIRELTDVEVLEIQITENLQRADLHPLEEAEGYEALHEKHKYSVDEIADKVGKSKAYVYARLKLCALTPAGRKAFYDGKLSASTALLVARIADKKLADQALHEILTQGDNWSNEPMSYREAQRHIEENYMLRLKDAPFPTGDAELIVKAGPCSSCPKRTGNQKELFGDVKSADLCTDPTCFAAKRDTWAQRSLEEARKAGNEILKGKDAAKVFDSYGQGDVRRNSAYVDADRQSWDYSDSGQTLRNLLGKKAPPVTMALDPKSGRMVSLFRKTDVEKALKAAGKLKRSRGGDGGYAAKQQKQARERAAIKREVLGALVEAAEKGQMNAGVWTALAAGTAARAWHDTIRDVVARRGLEVPKGERAEDVAFAAIEKASANQARGWLVELVMSPAVGDGGYGYSQGEKIRVNAIFTCYGLNKGNLEAKAKRAIAAAAAEKKAKAGKRRKTA